MRRLFFFSPSLLSSLPPAERREYEMLYKDLDLPEGRPFFMSDDGVIDEELDGFCQWISSGRRESGETWATYATQGDVFVRYMEAQRKDWKAATEQDLKAYYSVRTTGQFQSSKPLKGKSWNVAKAAIVHLYEYAVDAKLIETVPFKYRTSHSIFGSKNGLTPDLDAKTAPEPINFISLPHYKNHWRPLTAKGENAQRNLALDDLLITTGLRISEALGMELHQIPDPDNIAFAGRKSVSITVRGKGKKARKVRIPKRIVRAIRFYIEEDRHDAINQYVKKHGSNRVASTKVFLSREGNPLSKRVVQSRFMAVSIKTGLKLTPHGCRHTFAIYQLEAMIKRMAINLKSIKESGRSAYMQIMSDPLRELQKMMGHASILTTYIYLDFLEESEMLVEESLADWATWENEHGR